MPKLPPNYLYLISYATPISFLYPFHFYPIFFISITTFLCHTTLQQTHIFFINWKTVELYKYLYIIHTYNRMNLQSEALSLQKLKSLLHQGIQSIPYDTESKEAVMVIGDTGVGKSTIMSCLSGQQLVVRFDGIKATIDTLASTNIRIGHQKYSETSIPTKVRIDDMAFYDCPGFKDNKGEEYEISNSFFVQRLLDMHEKVKIVLIVDESHISQARADKLPRLLKNLHKSFRDFDEFQEGTCLIINRVEPDNTVEEYNNELMYMTTLKNENGSLFDEEESQFIKYLINNDRVVIFRKASKEEQNSTFKTDGNQKRILECIHSLNYVRTHHIENIISENAKLAIRDFIDMITINSNGKVEYICSEILELYSSRVAFVGRDYHKIMEMKENIVRLSQQIKNSEKTGIINILQRELPREKLQDFEEDFASVLFFKQIYDKTQTYFQNLVNKIYSELSTLLSKMDNQIAKLQKEEEQEKQRERIRVQKQLREEEARQAEIRRLIEQEQRKIREEQQRRKEQEKRRQKQRRQKQQAERLERIRQEEERKRKRQERERQEEQQRLQREREWRQRQEREREQRQRIERIKRQEKERQQRQRIERQARQWEQYQRKQKIEQEQRQRVQELKRKEQQNKYIEQLKRKAQAQKEFEEKERVQRERIQREKQEKERIERQRREKQQELLRRRLEEDKKMQQQRERRKLEEQRERIRKEEEYEREQKQNRQEQQEYGRMFSSAHHIQTGNYPKHIEREDARSQFNQRQNVRSYPRIDNPRQIQERGRQSARPSLIEQIQKAMQSLRSIEGELRKVKLDAVNLHNLNQEIGSEFVRIEQKYFSNHYKI